MSRPRFARRYAVKSLDTGLRASAYHPIIRGTSIELFRSGWKAEAEDPRARKQRNEADAVLSAAGRSIRLPAVTEATAFQAVENSWGKATFLASPLTGLLQIALPGQAILAWVCLQDERLAR